MDYHPYVIASSGDTTSFDNFRREALELAQRSLGMYDEKQEFKSITFDPKNISAIVQKYSNPTTYPIIPDRKYLEGLNEMYLEVGKRTSEDINAYLSEGKIVLKIQRFDISKDTRYDLLHQPKIPNLFPA